ncbi:TonB family protein [Stenotrophomonas sp. YIM B06876]|uniref:energy transducer TonB n=1 Tax=Stenotrophomonas sp. YIM B06876 TaxID=3060211 RepID=UPI00273A5629|nr:TonB family protein [Stenotrophomonas sp. YIM B06876]
MPASNPRPSRHIMFPLPRRSLQIAGLAFCAGLLLFLIVWLGSRDTHEYRAGPVQADNPMAEIAPLPEPLAASAGASDMPDARPQTLEEKPKLVETAPPQVVPEAPEPSTTAATPAPVASDLPVPLVDHSPAPAYPPAALRSGESGMVVVRVDVDASGVPAAVTLVQRSGSRLLDRAALEAVRDWRFQPAQNNGQAVPGSIEIPFDFKPVQ